MQLCSGDPYSYLLASYLSAYLSAYLSIYPSIYLSVCLSVLTSLLRCFILSSLSVLLISSDFHAQVPMPSVPVSPRSLVGVGPSMGLNVAPMFLFYAINKAKSWLEGYAAADMIHVSRKKCDRKFERCVHLSIYIYLYLSISISIYLYVFLSSSGLLHSALHWLFHLHICVVTSIAPPTSSLDPPQTPSFLPCILLYIKLLFYQTHLITQTCAPTRQRRRSLAAREPP